jgi:hypothetical protein
VNAVAGLSLRFKKGGRLFYQGRHAEKKPQA